MKALIKTIKFDKEVTTKQGVVLNVMKAVYVLEDKTERTASFFCKDKDKPPFKMGEINEFQEQSSEYQGEKQYNIKKIANKTGYNRNIKREQSKYSGFSTSYIKDMIIAGKIEINPKEGEHINQATLRIWQAASKVMFQHMVELDKTLEND